MLWLFDTRPEECRGVQYKLWALKEGSYPDHRMSDSIQDARARSPIRARLTLTNKPVHRSANGLHAHGVPESNEDELKGRGRREVKEIQMLKGKQLSRASGERTTPSPLMSIPRFVCAELAHRVPTGQLEICLFGTPHICRSGHSPQGSDQNPMVNDQSRMPIESDQLITCFLPTQHHWSLEISHWSFDPDNSGFYSRSIRVRMPPPFRSP